MSKIDKSATAVRLKELRIKYGIEVIPLSKMLGMTKSSVYLWEQGERIPSILSLTNYRCYMAKL